MTAQPDTDTRIDTIVFRALMTAPNNMQEKTINGKAITVFEVQQYKHLVNAIKDLIAEQVAAAKIDPFDYVQPCEPECTPERHAYHQGQWDMASRMSELKEGQK